MKNNYEALRMRCNIISKIAYVLTWILFFQALSNLDTSFKPLFDGVLMNRSCWEVLDAERLAKDAAMHTEV